MQIFIMCQGEQKRLASLGYPKQLIPLNGEPLLQRTIRLIKKLDFHAGITSIVIGRRDFAGVNLGYFHFELPDPGYCVLDGIAGAFESMNPTWVPEGGHTVFLLGDVVWSKAALTSFLADERPVVFAGTPILTASQGEVFGCKFADQDLLRWLLATVPCRFRPGDGHRIQYPQMQGGHLRRLYWHTMDAETLTSNIYLEINDWTDDIDEPADLKRIPEIERLIRLEEGT
jgi:hypothetical protein